MRTSSAISFCFALLIGAGSFLSAVAQSPSEWLTSHGQLTSLSETALEFRTGDTLALALLAFPPDSPYSTLRVELAVEPTHWHDTTSAAYLVVGTDSVGVLRLWAAGYSGRHQAVEWGPLRVTSRVPIPDVFPQKTKAVTILPRTGSLYFKWVISADTENFIEVNGVPLNLPPFILPWHITYVGIAIRNAAVRFHQPQVVRE